MTGVVGTEVGFCANGVDVWEAEEALVEVDEAREKVWPTLEAMEWSESRDDMREAERTEFLRASAS